MTPRRTEYRGLSRRGRALLSCAEGIDVEFKQSVASLEAADMVAFANSADGGALLVGVRDGESDDGRQIGIPVGCDIGDGPKLQILNKALSCVPPIQIEIVVENLSRVPFYRIEIPAGKQKPYCTSGGTYKVRENGRVLALHPEALLDVLVKREGTKFRERFEEATEGVLEAFEQVRAVIDKGMDAIEATVGLTTGNVDEAVYKIDNVESDARRVRNEVDRVQERLLGLLSHLDAKDPVKERESREFKESIKQQLRDQPALLDSMREGKKISVTHHHSTISEDETEKLFLQACREIIAEGSDEESHSEERSEPSES